MTPGPALVLLALPVGAADWVAVARGDRRLERVLKPAALLALIAAAVALRGGEPTARWWLTLAALALSLAGDVFLMLPDRFVAGLGAFLLAHLAYVAAFNPTPPPVLPTLPAALVVGAVAAAIYRRLVRGMAARGIRGLAVPVAVYVGVLGATVVSAAATFGRRSWPAGRSALALGGAVLFMASDALIGWTRFVEDVPGSRVLIMVTYHLGQAGLVLGLLG